MALKGCKIVAQYPDVVVLGGSRTQDVQVIGVLTDEHGVYFETRLPRSTATTANLQNNANGFTLIYELLFDIPGVAAVQWTQEPTPAGLLQDHVIVYVVSSSGDSEGVLDIPYAQFTQDIIAGKVGKLRDSLDATEAGL